MKRQSEQVRLSDHFTYKTLLRFTLPAMVMMVFTSLYGVVDGVFVTNFAGKTALAAVNFVYPVLNIISVFGFMFGAGGSALVAKTLGEGKRERANRLFSLFVYSAGGLGIVLAAAGFFALKPILVLLGAEGQMLSDALLYGYILLAAMPFWSLQFMFQIFFVTAEKPKLGLYVTLMAGVTNMVLDALFIPLFPAGFKLAGAAIATSLSQVVGGGLPLFYFLFKNKSLLRLTKPVLDMRAMLQACTNGSSELVTGISGSLVGLLYNSCLFDAAGEDGVAAYGVMMYVSFIFIGIFIGYSNGVAPVIGYHYGAKNHGELKNLFKKSMILILSASVFMLVLSELLALPLALLFSGYDEVLYEMTLTGFRIYALSFLFSGLAIFGSSFFTALNNGPVSAAISFLRTVVFQVLFVLLFSHLWQLSGIWWSVVAAEALAVAVSVFFMVLLRKRYHY